MASNLMCTDLSIDGVDAIGVGNEVGELVAILYKDRLERFVAERVRDLEEPVVCDIKDKIIHRLLKLTDRLLHERT